MIQKMLDGFRSVLDEFPCMKHWLWFDFLLLPFLLIYMLSRL